MVDISIGLWNRRIDGWVIVIDDWVVGINGWVVGFGDLAVASGFRSALVASGCGLPVIVVGIGASNMSLFGFVFVGLGFVKVPFSLAQWPKDPEPNNCGLVDWTWFTAAKELFKNQVVHRASFLQYK